MQPAYIHLTKQTGKSERPIKEEEASAAGSEREAINGGI